MRQEVFDYIRKQYHVSPDFPWRTSPESAVFRHEDSRKWFALVMTVSGEKVGASGPDPVDVINLKVDDMLLRDALIQEERIIPAYHMNKVHWITVLLDGTVPAERVYDLIGISFMATRSAKKK
ncbi:MAG: MmcQ/YjbR family DNA-binding protein [Bilifractor sp.]|jgi:predicted DNA-binding protein (MmcQ/YjbR family)